MYIANKERYETMKYNRCGKSGLLLPAFSLGLWHNFGSNDSYDNMVDLLTTAFDVLLTSTLQTITVRIRAVPKKTSVRF